MKRSFSNPDSHRGFTLIELLISMSISTLLIGCLCGVYMAVAKEWPRQQSQMDSVRAVSKVCLTIGDYVAQATSVTLITRFTSNDTIVCTMPAYTSHGIYTPVWNGSQFQYISGTSVVFYLSDSTGNYSTNGKILWGATFTNWGTFPSVMTKSPSWSLYYNTGQGKITPLQSMKYTIKNDGDSEYPSVTIKATSQYSIGNTTKTISQSRIVCIRND